MRQFSNKGQASVELALVSILAVLVIIMAVSYFMSPQAKDAAEGVAQTIQNVNLSQTITLEDQVDQITHLNTSGGIQQVELKGSVANILVTATPGACFLNMSMFVYWYTPDDPYTMLKKEFEHENTCFKNKSDVLSGLRDLHEKISRWIKEANIDPITIQKWIQPYLDDLFNLSLDVLKL